MSWTWSRKPKAGKRNYEFSSKGDKRFSPLYAKLPSGITVEEWYHLDLKGYRGKVGHWIEAKGRNPLNPMSPEYRYHAFKQKLVEFLFNDIPLLKEFIEIAKHHDNFIDRFATTKINQARAYADIARDLSKGLLKLPVEPEVKNFISSATCETCIFCGVITNYMHQETGRYVCTDCGFTE